MAIANRNTADDRPLHHPDSDRGAARVSALHGAGVGLHDARHLGELLDQFRSNYEKWFARFRETDPLYSLPKAVISVLAGKDHRGKQLIGESDASAELAFSLLCERFTAVGFWASDPIVYECLRPLNRPPDVKRLHTMGWTRQQISAVMSMIARSEGVWRRLRGYAGWLVLDPDFRRQRDKLARAWTRLEFNERPGFPLHCGMAIASAPQSRIASDAASKFQAKLDAFLLHWGLKGMMTWDLPEPQGPLIPALMEPGATAMPRHGLHIVLPTHYPLTGEDLLLKEIQNQQLQIAREANLDPSIAGLPHFEAYGSLFEVHHLESTIRRRYGQRGGGFVKQMENAIAAALRIDASYVQKLRKGISAILRGKRSSIRWLHVKNRKMVASDGF